MWGNRYWAQRYWPDRYWAPGGAAVVVVAARPTSSRNKTRQRMSRAIYDDDEIMKFIHYFLNHKDPDAKSY